MRLQEHHKVNYVDGMHDNEISKSTSSENIDDRTE
jgi:hypothetical protein